MNGATPKTLKEAIQNGLTTVMPGKERVDIVLMHVKDFLSQKFGASFTEDIQKLWTTLFPEDRR
jgi:hypothetical protein